MFKFTIRTIKIIIFLILIVLGINIYMVAVTATHIEKEIDVTIGELNLGSVALNPAGSIDPQCILVFGAGVRVNGEPTPILRDRLDTGIALYKAGVAPKLLFSGDNGKEEYDEVTAMKRYAISQGVPEEDIYLDHAGFSTYESVYRAQYIFGVERAVIVTQKYHLFRALYGCDKMGIEATGVASDLREHPNAVYREAREVLARTKDFFMWIFKPEPTFLGEKIPL